jgi:hypothetical protein
MPSVHIRRSGNANSTPAHALHPEDHGRKLALMLPGKAGQNVPSISAGNEPAWKQAELAGFHKR